MFRMVLTSVFEPDLSNMTSLEELESCEKQLEDTLTTVTERKVRKSFTSIIQLALLLRSVFIQMKTCHAKISKELCLHNLMIPFHMLQKNLLNNHASTSSYGQSCMQVSNETRTR